MKSFSKWNLQSISQMALVAVVVALGACGEIPSAYRGYFRDNRNSTSLKMKANKGVLTSPNEIIESKARALEFKHLLAGEAGIYVRANPTNEKLLDVFWIKPNMNTRQAAGGMVWYETDVYYSLFDARLKDKVSTIRLLHSGQGTVMLEEATELWQVGWPANPMEYEFTRIQK